MARYEYRCDDCGKEELFEFSMQEPKVPVPCTNCHGRMRRVFTPNPDIWKSITGQNVRSPGKQWVGGDHFDSRTFYEQNPNARKARK